MIKTAGITKQGPRPSNQDSFLATQCTIKTPMAEIRPTIAVVADGNGGEGGDRAAAEVIKAVSRSMFHDLLMCSDCPGDEELRNMLHDALQESHHMLNWLKKEGELRSEAGSTVTAMIAAGERLALGWVGDSPAFFLDRNGCRELTRRHNLARHFVEKGHDHRQIAGRPELHCILTRCLGFDAQVEPEIEVLSVAGPCLFILGSDGALGEFGTDPLEELVHGHLAGGGNMEALCDAIVDRALAAGSHDNSTVLIVDFGMSGRHVKSGFGTRTYEFGCMNHG